MTIAEIIRQLRAFAELHGETTEVFFDCPKCGVSFCPNTVEKKAIHVTGKAT